MLIKTVIIYYIVAYSVGIASTLSLQLINELYCTRSKLEKKKDSRIESPLGNHVIVFTKKVAIGLCLVFDD